MSGWPWFIALFWLVVIEFVLIARHKRTLSERARAAGRRYPWLPYAVIATTVVLYGHFWWGWLW